VGPEAVDIEDVAVAKINILHVHVFIQKFVVHANIVTGLDSLVGEPTPDVSGSSSDEYLHRSDLLFLEYWCCSPREAI
jgi:hypothetical protein